MRGKTLAQIREEGVARIGREVAAPIEIVASGEGGGSFDSFHESLITTERPLIGGIHQPPDDGRIVILTFSDSDQEYVARWKWTRRYDRFARKWQRFGDWIDCDTGIAIVGRQLRSWREWEPGKEVYAPMASGVS